jgi:hypothetical protein
MLSVAVEDSNALIWRAGYGRSFRIPQGEEVQEAGDDLPSRLQ